LKLRFGIIAALLSLVGGYHSAEAQALQCVPFAREHSGINLKGDAWTWWTAAAGQYDRGQAPRLGAVVVFKKHGSMSHGHVAVVANVVNPRRLLVDHANWAPHRSHGRGQVTKMVIVTDVSPRNDWSMVRVWNEASGELGQKIYPTYGFIYPRPGQLPAVLREDDEIAESLPSLAFAGSPPIGEERPYSLDNASAVGAVASLGDLLAPSAQSAILAVESGVSQ
jgi:surface antigen